jgi:phage gp29-like protein
LKKLETDDEIFAALRTRRESVVATPWRFEGGVETVNAFLREELAPHMESIIAGAWRALPYGYSVMEAVYAIHGGKVGLAEISAKPIEWFDPRPDGTLRYFSPDYAGVEGVECDLQLKFFLTRSDPSYLTPKGEALLSRLYWPWFFRFNGWRFWGQFLERFGQPLIVGKSGDPAKMSAALLGIHSDASIAVGRDDEVTAISSAATGEAFDRLEQCVVRRYQKLILGQTLTSDTGKGGGGSYALGKVHADVKEGLRRADIRLVQHTIERIIQALCFLNKIAPANIPELVFADDAGLEEARADRDVKLSSLGVKFSKEYFTERYDLREDDFDMGVPVVPAPPTSLALPNLPLEAAKRYVRDPNRFTSAQQQIDDVVNDTLAVCGQPTYTDVIRQAVLASRDPGDLTQRLALLMSNANNPQLAALLEQALLVANVLGYANADGKV